MAKFKTIQGALNAGELAPKLRGRTDIPRYQHGLERCRNAVPLVSGGVLRFPGSRYVGSRNATSVRKIPFKHSGAELTGWMLHLTDTSMTFCKDGQQIMSGGSPYSIATPYTNAELREVKHSQFDNQLYLVHPNHHPQRLTRTADADWAMEAVPFTEYPFQRPPNTAGITLAPSATSGSITLLANAPFFQAGHVGCAFKVNGGVVVINAVTDSTHASGDLSATISVSGTKSIRGDMLVRVTAAAPGTYDLSVRATADYNAVSLTVGAGDIFPAWAAVVPVDALNPPPFNTANPSYQLNTLTGTEPDKDWTEIAWSDLRGWPRSICFFEQRLNLAGSATYPTTVWGSKSGDVLNFLLGALDDDAYSFTLAAATTPIYHLLATDRIFAFTQDREISIDGSGKPITPTNVQIKVRGNDGCSATVAPLALGGEIFFASPTGRLLRAMAYRLESDTFRAPDLAVLADHLLPTGIIAMAHTREPVPMLWLVTSGGDLLTLTIDRGQDVAAWARQWEGVNVLDVISVPAADGTDTVWLTTRRTVAGVATTFIEVVDWSLQTACSVTASGAIATAWPGFDHLGGEPLQVVADGFYAGEIAPAGGSIDLPFAAATIAAGIPYVTRVKDLPLEIGGQGQTAQGHNMAVGKIRVRLFETSGCTVNGERVPFQQFGQPLFDTPIAPYTGDKLVQNFGRGNEPEDSQVEIVQDLPLPLHLLAIIKEVAVNG